MSRDDPNATKLYLRWTNVLGCWITCEQGDRTAVPFLRGEVEPTKRHWIVGLDGVMVGYILDHVPGQHAMLHVEVEADTAQEAEAIALAQENDPDVITDLKVISTRLR